MADGYLYSVAIAVLFSGEGMIYRHCYSTPDIEKAYDELIAAGVQPEDENANPLLFPYREKQIETGHAILAGDAVAATVQLHDRGDDRKPKAIGLGRALA